MAWRAMDSLLVLRDQVNSLAPYRAKGSDGLVGDENHSSSSGHYPHYVPGVGSEIVTALDLTHDPAHGCDTYELSETLRRNRDDRIRYVISNGRIFSSYASDGRDPWEWGPYDGSDPHDTHSHTQVLDDEISDTGTPWNLEGFGMSEQIDYLIRVLNARVDAIIHNRPRCKMDGYTDSTGKPWPGLDEENVLCTKLNAIGADVATLLEEMPSGGGGTGGDCGAVAGPMSLSLSGSLSAVPGAISLTGTATPVEPPPPAQP